MARVMFPFCAGLAALVAVPALAAPLPTNLTSAQPPSVKGLGLSPAEFASRLPSASSNPRPIVHFIEERPANPLPWQSGDLQSATNDLLPLDDDLGLIDPPPAPLPPTGPNDPPVFNNGGGGSPTPVVVPVPMPGVMTIAGLAALAAWRRRRP